MKFNRIIKKQWLLSKRKKIIHYYSKIVKKVSFCGKQILKRSKKGSLSSL